MRTRALVKCAALWGLLWIIGGTPACGWSHQGHILITRLACLRIMQDPAAPAGLKAWLVQNMTADLSACQTLATGVSVGAAPAPEYLAGFDGACTWPDRLIDLPAGKELISPYSAPESKMHYLDLEEFCTPPIYKDDLSNTPKPADLPRDLHDSRYARAGYVPFRVDESYRKLVAALGSGPRPSDPAAALQWAGYLAHYLEDCHQPHHSTVDYKSLSYLAGRVKEVETRTITLPGGATIATYRSASPAINPHGDIEFQLFENVDEPRRSLRAQYWRLLQADLAQLDQGKLPLVPLPEKGFNGFDYAMRLLLQGHGYLPLIGHAAQAAYARDVFDAQAFFTFREPSAPSPVGSESLSILEMIALQNARAVIAVEKTLRRAWEDARP